MIPVCQVIQHKYKFISSRGCSMGRLSGTMSRRYPQKRVSTKTTHPHSPRLFTHCTPCQKNRYTHPTTVFFVLFLHVPRRVLPVEMGGSNDREGTRNFLQASIRPFHREARTEAENP